MELRLESREGFLWGTVTGRIFLGEALEVFERACDAAIEHGLNKALVFSRAMQDLVQRLKLYLSFCRGI